MIAVVCKRVVRYPVPGEFELLNSGAKECFHLWQATMILAHSIFRGVKVGRVTPCAPGLARQTTARTE